MGKKSAKKIVGHQDLAEGETVIDACYGVGKGFLQLADMAGGMRHVYNDQADAAMSDPAGSEASRIDRTGIIALTDRRLIFLPVKTAVRKPKAVTNSWTHAEVTDVTYEKPMLTLTFGDGSVGGLHVPRAEKPKDFVTQARLVLDAT